jgi:hypothetical protein
VALTSLRELLVRFLGSSAREVWNTLVEKRQLRGADLINFICFHLDVSPIEKQTMLEARDARAGCLLDVLTFKLEERKLGPGGDKGGGGPTRVQ